MPVSGSTGYRSGFLGLPPRVNLRKIDDAMGTYPTIARTGDPDYTGKFPSRFDDTIVLDFSGSAAEGTDTNQNVVYPLLLPKNYLFATSSVSNSFGFSLGVAQPNISSSISLNRCLVSGISDRMFRFSTNNEPSQSFRPFDESRVYLGTSSDFYLTGTDPSILPGFASRLADKTQIVIDLNPTEETQIFWSTGTLPHGAPYANRSAGLAAGVNSGLAYFNWDRQVWEIIGNTITGSNVDYVSKVHATRTGSMWAFPNGITGIAFTTVGTAGFAETAQASGYPSNFAGFPLASKFDATGTIGATENSGQLLAMSQYINQPFLVEKIVFEWTGSHNTVPLGQGPLGILSAYGNQWPQTSAFFILNQFETVISRSVNTGEQFYSYPSPSSHFVVRTHGPYDVAKEKDMVGFGTITRAFGIEASALKKREQRDLVLEGGHGTYGVGGITGSFRVEFDATVPGIYPDALGPLTANRRGSNQYLFVGNPDGGRDLFGCSSGRSFIASTVGAVPSGSKFLPFDYDNPQYVQPYEDLTRVSPYVLMPTDKLVFGFVNQATPWADSTNYTAQWSERVIANTQRVVMAPGPSKVTLFGSLLRNSLPLAPETNQPLTSDAIHEALHSDNPVVDQFQVEPFYTYRRSYIDEVYSGKFIKGTRTLSGLCTEGTQGTTGSLLRGVRLKDPVERYYDSLMPSLDAYFAKTVMSGVVFQLPSPGVTTGNRPALGYKDLPLKSFYFSGAMEIPSPGSETIWKGNRSLPFPYAGEREDNPSRVVKDDAGLIVSASAGDLAYEVMLDYEQIKEAIFQVGVQDRSFDVFTSNPRVPAGFQNKQIISDRKFTGARGLRYGIANTKALNSACVFRYDRFGQFRDMLEQRIDTRFYDASDTDTHVLDSPVKIIFVNLDNELVNPEDTISQNLSKFATSSLPYMDGMAVDRTGDPYNETTIIIEEVQ